MADLITVVKKEPLEKERISSLLSVRVHGIPCLVRVDSFHNQKPNCRADNPDDYYGYTEIEFTLFDRKGYRAKWLDKLMDDSDIEAVEKVIIDDAGSCDDGFEEPDFDYYDYD